MKRYFFSSMILNLLVVSCNDSGTEMTTALSEMHEPETIVYSKNDQIIQMLDTGEIVKAMELISQDKFLGKSRGVFLLDCSNARYNAEKIIEEEKVIILRGRFWIRSEKTLIDGRQSDESFAVLHKKTMRIIELGGEYEMTTLLTD